MRTTPSYKGLQPASPRASHIARAASRKKGTSPELLLRRALKKRRVRHKVCVTSLPGCPDIVIASARLAVFCDGDFWHGRNLKRGLAKLAVGHNPGYWVSKIKTNVQRDRLINRRLKKEGWTPLRFWESDIRADPDAAAEAVVNAVRRVSFAKAKR